MLRRILNWPGLLLLFVLQELHDLRRKNSALQMQQFVGEEKNDLLDYLRSLTPEKVYSRLGSHGP